MPMLFVFSALISLGFAENLKHPKSTPLLSEEEIARKYTLQELYSAINGLRSVIDGQSWCNVEFDEAKNSMLPLRPIYEKKLAAEKEKKLPIKKLLTQSKNCKKYCSCQIISELLKDRTDIAPENFSQIQKLDRANSAKELNNCAKRQTKICSGPLLKSLKAISKKEYQAPSDF